MAGPKAAPRPTRAAQAPTTSWVAAMWRDRGGSEAGPTAMVPDRRQHPSPSLGFGRRTRAHTYIVTEWLRFDAIKERKRVK